MVWFKRIGLFLAINLLIVLAISIITSFFGLGGYLTSRGLDYGALAAFCLIYGMVGAFISLALSRVMAKWMMGVQVIEPQNASSALERQLIEKVHALAHQAHLPKMPEVGIYESPEVNAFATGPTKSRALVAVSTGLLERMSDDEVEGVLGHEISHIANGDMVTMTLIQGIVNAFVMFLSRAVAYAIANALRSNRDSEGSSAISHGIFYLVSFVLEIVFMFFGMMVIAWFSRQREFRADRGGAEFAGKTRMVSALERLKSVIEIEDPAAQPALQTLKISSRGSGLMRLFSTHPSLDERIERLNSAA